MKIIEQQLRGVFEITSQIYEDNRGALRRTFDTDEFRNAGIISTQWFQESYSHTHKKNTIRGLHVSLPPCVEGKLITPTRGEMLWVVVDVRKNSKTFGSHLTIILSNRKNNSLYVPRWFAHGCVSLTDDCDLVIKSDNAFSETKSTGIRWNDSDLAIDWCITNNQYIISERDSHYGSYKEFCENHNGV